MFRLIHGSSGLRPSTRGYEVGTHKGCNPAPPGSVEVDGFSKSEQVSSALSDSSDPSDLSDKTAHQASGEHLGEVRFS